MDIGVLQKNQIIRFVKPDSLVFTEKTCAQKISTINSRHFRHDKIR
jgi:hypothetical protein